MGEIDWSDRARADLHEVVSFIATDSPAYARSWATRLRHSVERLRDFPASGRLVPEDATRTLREVIVGNYRVLYRQSVGGVTIVTVIHGARRLSLP